ncbi:putative DNL zinc finger [Lyophyllum shimeji]|uniref:DNL zinc finger n=1 Tax=Lyophyllum shimeji TaxID=47721 RepID=A0A9P3PUQ3_LYOSH|nr:putative DNL zinc finger [Lyophyllum shimeji]
MLPSRLFRNTGLPPALRSLITPHTSLHPSIAVQLRFRLGVLPHSLSSAYTTPTPTSTTPNPPAPQRAQPPQPTDPPGEATKREPTTAATLADTTSVQPVPENFEPRLSMTFTCTAPGCGRRSTHQFSRRAYERGVVLVQCPGCENRHLIADHLGWFKDNTQGGKLPTVEDILRERGEKVRRGSVNADGVVEYSE